MPDQKFVGKLQVPLASNEKDAPAMVYNEDRTIQFFLPMTDEILNMMNGRPKAYFNMTFPDGKSDVVIGEEVPNPGW